MTPSKARTVLHALTQGIDPETGAELPKQAITFRSDILRAMYAGIAALDLVDARAKRRAQLPESVGKPWTPEEEATLTAEFRAGREVASIAEAHSRTVRAIEARLERLGLITAAERTTSNTFMGEGRPSGSEGVHEGDWTSGAHRSKTPSK